MKTVNVAYDDSIISKLKNAFTSIECVYTEAMQNARRAKATRVDFYTTAGHLIISDNGGGIADLQDFLTLAGSGWGEETIKREGAFGMGSFAMLYACESIIVESNGQRFESDSQVLLNGHDVQICQSDVVHGTKITMTLEGLPETEVEFFNLISGLAKGFAIDVFVNDIQCEQPHRLNDDFVEIGVGKAFIPGISNADECPRYRNGSPILYFQGLRVDRQQHQTTPHTVVHLDEQQFEVRMPDRDVLIDQDKQNKLIESQIMATWVEYLTAKKAELNSDEFVKLYPQMRKHGCLDLLNDVPLVPKEVLFVVNEAPHCERPNHNDSFSEETSVHRNDIGKVLSIEDYVDSETVWQWQYAYHTGALCYATFSLHDKHWLHRHIVELDDDKVIVSSVDKKTSTSFKGDWVCMSCEFGETVLMEGPLDTVDIKDDVIFKDGKMYIPAQFTDGEAILKANTFSNYDDFDETAYQNEEQIFGAFLMRHNGSVLEAFKTALDNPYINGLGIMDKKFEVVFHAKGFEVAEVAA
ncbi:MAG: hypothetical protein P1U35_12875 [Cycloclasticus sp.]|nr:hypothetical protein [Cycloclasticus sp.]